MDAQHKVKMAFKTASIYLCLGWILDCQIKSMASRGRSPQNIRFNEALRDKMYEEAMLTWGAAKIVQKML